MDDSPLYVNREMLTVARESRGFNQSDFATRLGVTQGMVSKMEIGALNISVELLARICETLHFPESFFRSRDPIYGPGVSEFYHRSLKRVSKRRINNIYARINIKLVHLSRLLRSIEWDKQRTIPAWDIDEFEGKPDRIAQALRAKWLVPKGPIPNLTDLVEDAGGIVITFDFGTDDVAAISRWVPGMPPVFFVNQNMPADRIRLSLAHELGHMIMHRSTNPQMEDQAYLFAGEFLMPADEIQWRFRNITLPKLADLKPYWKVSMAALLHRAGDLRCLTDNQKRYLWSQLSRAGYLRREPSPLDIQPEPPTLLADIMSHYANDLGLSLDEFAHLISLYPDEAQEEYMKLISENCGYVPLDASDAIAEVEQILRGNSDSNQDP